jgi:hypothetical protein
MSKTSAFRIDNRSLSDNGDPDPAESERCKCSSLFQGIVAESPIPMEPFRTRTFMKRGYPVNNGSCALSCQRSHESNRLTFQAPVATRSA